MKACDNIVQDMLTRKGNFPYRRTLKEIKQDELRDVKLNRKDYMKVMRKSCRLDSGRHCVLLGNEFHNILVDYYGKLKPKYGANCSLRSKNEAFKYYKKSCDLGESEGCELYTGLQNDIDELDRCERDKTQKAI